VLDLLKVEELSSKYDIAVPHPSLQWTGTYPCFPRNAVLTHMLYVTLEQDLAFFKSAAGETVFSQLVLIPEPKLPPNFVFAL